MNTIVIGFDHAGYLYADPIIRFLQKRGYTVLNVWPERRDDTDDFPDFAYKACQKILLWEAEKWVLICGTGIGMSMAANRHTGIRAVLAYDPEVAKISRTHNDANIACFGAQTMDIDTVFASLEVFLTTEFLGGKYQRRNEMLDGYTL